MKAFDELLNRKPSGDLFHYTTQVGLLGIIKNAELWASHVRYLNDASEFNHAVTIAGGLATQMADREGDPKRRKLLEEIIQGIYNAGINVCVVSFSEEGNLLSQWRAYSHGSTGSSLGFAASDLIKAAETLGWILVRCVYDEEEQRRLLSAMIEETLSENLNIKEQEKNAAWDLFPGGNIRYYLNRYAAIFKDRNFQEEREWRLISRPLNSTDDRFEYREGRSTIIPYYRFPLKTGDERQFTLRRVYVGPTPNPVDAKQAVLSLLASKWMDGVPVDISLIPFRTW